MGIPDFMKHSTYILPYCGTPTKTITHTACTMYVPYIPSVQRRALTVYQKTVEGENIIVSFMMQNT